MIKLDLSRHLKGYLGEYLALLWLGAKGYRFRSHRYRSPIGEIDLIMSRHNIICFIEVKYRHTQTLAAQAITPHQQARIKRTAQAYLQRHPNFLSYQMRFDAVLLSPTRLPRHVKNCW